METFEEYVRINYSNIIDEYYRYSTPFYYEMGVEYEFINQEVYYKDIFLIENGRYSINGKLQSIRLYCKSKPDLKISYNIKDIPLKIKRVDETIKPIGNLIPQDKQFFHLKFNDTTFTIFQTYSRDYSSNYLTGRVIVKSDKMKRVNGYDEYFELYNYINKGWSLKHVFDFDSIGRENYKLTHNITVRNFKEIVFGDANIKLKNDV